MLASQRVFEPLFGHKLALRLKLLLRKQCKHVLKVAAITFALNAVNPHVMLAQATLAVVQAFSMLGNPHVP
ncbi:MAG TPA: hypothetical protein VHL10_03515 [Nitrososphaera sp.]|nr:hypothetical protein [Nitrososphaera sp.]